jgi:hypothetical protein
MKIDLYGKKLVFKFIDVNFGNNYNIEYLQEIIERTKIDSKGELTIEVSYQ